MKKLQFGLRLRLQSTTRTRGANTLTNVIAVAENA